MGRVTNWNKKLLQEKSDKLHNNKFIIHDIDLREVGNQGMRTSYIDLECLDCNYRCWMIVNNHIHNKTGCRKCSLNIWTLEKAQKKSKEIHNNKFIIHSIKVRGTDRLKRSWINLECKLCGYNNWVSITQHIDKKNGCGGSCRGNINRKKQIIFLKENPILANEPYNLYLLRFSNYNEIFYKIGKTKGSIKDRFINYKNYIIEEIKILKSTHLWVAEQEDKFIENFKQYQYTPSEKFEGHTECFREEIYNILFKEKSLEA